MRLKNYLILFITALCFSVSVQAQKIITAGKEVNFLSYGISEGLNIGLVNNLHQDSKGQIWICSQGQIAKFDGINFKHYGEKEGLPGGAASATEDKEGNMWFGSWKGLYVLKGNKFFVDTSKGMPRHLSWDLFTDKDGTIWVANGLGVYHIDPAKIGGRFIKHYYITGEKGNNSVRNIFRNKKGELIAGAEIGCFVMKNDSFVYRNGHGSATYAVIEFDDGREWYSAWGQPLYEYKNGKVDTVYNLGSSIIDMTMDHDGNVFLATWEKGVYKYDGKNFYNYSPKNGLGYNSFWSTFCDREGNIWLGSWGAGIFKYNGELVTRISEKTGLLSNIVNKIVQADDGKIWISSETGITSYDPTSQEVKVYDKFTKAKQQFPQIMSITDAPNNEIWGFGYSGNGFKIIKNEVIPAPELGAFGSLRDSKDRIWLATENSAYYYENGIRKGPITVNSKEAVNSLNGIYEDAEGNYWMTNYLKGINICIPAKDSLGQATYEGINLSKKQGFKTTAASSIIQFKAFCYFIAVPGKGIYTCRYHNKRIEIIDSLTEKTGLISDAVSSLKIYNNTLYIGTPYGVSVIKVNDLIQGKKQIRNYSDEDGLLGKMCEIQCQDKEGMVWIKTYKGAYCLNPNLNFRNDKEALIQISSVKLFFEDFDFIPYCKNFVGELPTDLKLPYDKNHLTFSFIGVNHTAPEKVKYQYKLVGYDKQWSPINDHREATYSNISPGTYTFMVKAGNNDGIWNKEPAQFVFRITPPFWRTKWFYGLCAIVIIGSFIIYVRWREKKLKREKQVLENKVEERTSQLKNAFAEIEEKNKEITDSINYSQRIQRAILPDLSDIKENSKDFFILYQPKDIVSGDFYYFHKAKNGHIIAAVDCTGHGVPGAFMSLVGKENLDKAVEISQDPGKILELLNNNVKNSLKQNKVDGTRDGMDIALVSFTKQGLKYSGANRPLWIIRKGGTEVEEIKPNKIAIGGFTEDDQRYLQHDVNVVSGDTIYIFTDGYPDQFGGEKHKKLTSKVLKTILLKNSERSMEEQRAALDDFMKEWKKNTEQIDDICVIGIKI